MPKNSLNVTNDRDWGNHLRYGRYCKPDVSAAQFRTPRGPVYAPSGVTMRDIWIMRARFRQVTLDDSGLPPVVGVITSKLFFYW